jgi:hypothetical protein
MSLYLPTEPNTVLSIARAAAAPSSVAAPPSAAPSSVAAPPSAAGGGTGASREPVLSGKSAATPRRFTS